MIATRPLVLLALTFLVHAAFGHPGSSDLRHWEIASPDPDRIVLAWTGDPATNRSVTWRTDSSVGRAFAELTVAGREARFDLGAKRIPAKTEALESSRAAIPLAHYHSVVFDDLQPGTLYAYRVGDGADRWSEWIQFRTARQDRAPFRFLYFGDAQNAVLSHWSRIIRAAYQEAPDAAFAIHAGDLINTAHRDREWAEWFKAGGWIHASLPTVAVSGNHEFQPLDPRSVDKTRRLALQWQPQFTLPVVEELPKALHETVYAFDYQGVRVIALNSNSELAPQAKWLEATLSDNPNRWTIITMHHPIFSSGGGRDNQANRALLKPIIDKYGVDLLLQGHDHTYARGHTPVHMSEDAAETVRTIYVNSVSGPKMYQFRKEGWNVYRSEGAVLDRKAENTPFFQVIDVKDDDLTYRAHMADGAIYDAFILHKNADGSKTLLDGTPNLGGERLLKNTPPYNLQGL